MTEKLGINMMDSIKYISDLAEINENDRIYYNSSVQNLTALISDIMFFLGNLNEGKLQINMSQVPCCLL